MNDYNILCKRYYRIIKKFYKFYKRNDFVDIREALTAFNNWVSRHEMIDIKLTNNNWVNFTVHFYDTDIKINYTDRFIGISDSKQSNYMYTHTVSWETLSKKNSKYLKRMYCILDKIYCVYKEKYEMNKEKQFVRFFTKESI